MRRKKNITLNSQNITLHFTGKEKIITLSLIIIMLSFANIINTSALSYQSSVGVGFTFNPTLSVSISPSDLTIANLVPGNTLDSNVINVSVASNASYGYTLSAIVNGNNNYLTHSNVTNIFNSIATDADLADLEDSEDTNIWGYSTSLDSGTTWSNYNGLSNSNNATLLSTNTNNTKTGIDSVDFKIAAKASNTQTSGTYTGVINFTAVTKPTPMNLAESYFAAGKTRHNGYYTMQDMTSEICNNTEVIGEGSQTELIDLRDDKVYWATKLADGHCWMTQNLDLDLDSNRTYTHYDTDLGWSTENDYTINENATWKPTHSTIDFAIGSNIPGWANSNIEPYSANPGDIYFYTSNSDANDIQYNSLQECINAGHNNCTHYHAGNYYNWSAAVGNNDTSELIIQYDNSPDSVCPKNWRLPKRDQITKKLDYATLVDTYRANATSIRIEPLYFIRSGVVRGSVTGGTLNGYYYHGTIYNDVGSYFMSFSSTFIRPNEYSGSYYARRFNGYPIRCLAR